MSDYIEHYGPYGSPANQMGIASASANSAYKNAIEDVCAYVETLNDMYNWNDWVVGKIRTRFEVPDG